MKEDVGRRRWTKVVKRVNISLCPSLAVSSKNNDHSPFFYPSLFTGHENLSHLSPQRGFFCFSWHTRKDGRRKDHFFLKEWNGVDRLEKKKRGKFPGQRQEKWKSE